MFTIEQSAVVDKQVEIRSRSHYAGHQNVMPAKTKKNPKRKQKPSAPLFVLEINSSASEISAEDKFILSQILKKSRRVSSRTEQDADHDLA
jgi:hypothetical protein